MLLPDLAYADDFNDQGGDGQGSGAVPANNFVTYANTTKTLSQTYQPKWCAHVPCLGAAGLCSCCTRGGSACHSCEHRCHRLVLLHTGCTRGVKMCMTIGQGTTHCRCARESMARLLQRSGNGTSLPYSFGPGNHEASLRHSALRLSALWAGSVLDCAVPWDAFAVRTTLAVS